MKFCKLFSMQTDTQFLILIPFRFFYKLYSFLCLSHSSRIRLQPRGERQKEKWIHKYIYNITVNKGKLYKQEKL